MKGVLSVSQVTSYIKERLESDTALSQLLIRGELSDYTIAASGHCYFSLKDQDAVLRCVFFRGDNQAKHAFKHGMMVLARGSISVYAQRGNYQFIVRSMIPAGVGELYREFEHLKKKLRDQGLFDKQIKKTLPLYPEKIGVVTSDKGAALRDILHVLERRYPLVQVYVSPSLVQGEQAPVSLIHALKRFEEVVVDVIILARGGGSFEDLFCFNDEALARAIFSCSTPVVSAVGHETDFTIADFVADVRAPTPSAAAEIVVPSVSELSMSVREGVERMLHSLEQLLAMNKQIVDFRVEHLVKNYAKAVEMKRTKYQTLVSTLASLNPSAVLERGYALAIKQDKPLRSVESVKSGDAIIVMLLDGEIAAKVEEVRK